MLSPTVSQTEKVSCLLFSVPFICSVKLSQYKLKGRYICQYFITGTKQSFSNLYHGLSGAVFLRKVIIVSFYRKKQSDIAAYYSVGSDLVY